MHANKLLDDNAVVFQNRHLSDFVLTHLNNSATVCL